MPAVAGELFKLVGDHLATPDRKLTVRLMAAEWSLQHEGGLRPPSYPARPPELPYGDRELALLLGAVDRMGERASKQDQEIAAVFGEWRYMVWQAEAEASARIECLYELGRTFLEASEACPDDEHLKAQLRRVEEIARVEWGFELLPLPERCQQRRRAARLAVRDDVLPAWLGACAEPPRESRLRDYVERDDFAP